MNRITCTGCSLLCDDILLRTDGLFIDEVVGACKKGKERFDHLISKNRILSPMIRKNDALENCSWDVAINKTVEIIKASSNPLLYGFSNVSCEAQFRAIELARNINGFIDSNSSICQGQVLNIAKNIGITLTTITEVINKADLIILWGANAAEAIPRLLNKILFSRGKFRMTGREIKTLIIIDPVKTSSFNVMGVRDLALQIQPKKDLDLIRTLKEECCTANSIPSEGVAGIDIYDLKRLLLLLSEAENGVIIVGQGLLQITSESNPVKELLELIQMINLKQQKGRISLIMMGGHFNMAGFDHVALSTCGKSGSLQFKNKKLLDSNDTIISKIYKNEFDSSIIVSTDPISHFPHILSQKLASKPLIAIDNIKSPTTILADVVLPTALTGIEGGGTAYRLDQVPIELKAILKPPNKILTDEDVLIKIINKIKEI